MRDIGKLVWLSKTNKKHGLRLVNETKNAGF